MSAWLITGGAGFIGSNFVRALPQAAPAQIVVLDALTYSGNLASIADLIDARQIDFVHGDIRDPSALAELFARHDFQRVVHFAAESHVDRSIVGPRAFVETNVIGTLNLLAAARDRWQGSFAGRVFLHVSTDEVFGSLAPGAPPFDERTPYAPNSPYAASKAASDHLVRAWHHTYGFPSIITNCSNNYGPWQFPEKLIPLMILNAIGGRELPVYGDGQQIRDWLHVQDHCDALHAVLERGTVGTTYCIGGGQQHANLQVVTSICDLVAERLGQTPRALRGLIRHVEDRPGHDRRYAIDSSRMRRELGWTPRFELMTALPAVVDWYLAHEDWVTGICSGEYLRFYEQQYSQRLRKTS
jgi:dTDP-glucose 4,6-dehydratase